MWSLCDVSYCISSVRCSTTVVFVVFVVVVVAAVKDHPPQSAFTTTLRMSYHALLNPNYPPPTSPSSLTHPCTPQPVPTLLRHTPRVPCFPPGYRHQHGNPKPQDRHRRRRNGCVRHPPPVLWPSAPTQLGYRICPRWFAPSCRCRYNGSGGRQAPLCQGGAAYAREDVGACHGVTSLGGGREGAGVDGGGIRK
jgi:hypothetical protein